MATGMMVGAGIGALSAKMQGQNVFRGAFLGGALGGAGGALGSAIQGGTAAGASTAAVNSLGGGSALLSGSGGALGSSVGSGTAGFIGGAAQTSYPQALLGNATGNINAYAIPETLGSSFSSAIPETSQVVNNSYVPFGNDYGTTSNFGNSQLNGTKGIGPNMSAQQTFLDTTPDISQGNFGTPQQLNYADEMGMQRQLTHGYTDGVANKTNTNIGANFNTDQITKSTPSDLKLAQGGYEKPLYEKAFDSVMSYASENPIQMAALGLTAFGDKGTSSNTAPPRSGGGSVSRSPFVRMKQPILNVRRTV